MAVSRSMAKAFSKDRLSALPDDLLLKHIVRKISYRDVVRSSSLSRRWRLLLKKITILKFSPQDFEKQKDDEIHTIIKNALLHLDARLDYLEINVDLDDPKTADLRNWIRLAAEKQVRRMFLRNFYRDIKTVLNASNVVEIGRLYFRCENLSALKVNFVKLPKIPNNVGAFRYLKSFYCYGIMIVDDMLQGFIDLCPHLRNLSIRNCLGLKSLNIRSSNLMYLSLGLLSGNLSVQIGCPMLRVISLLDTDKHIGLKLLQGIPRGESIKKIILQTYNANNAVNPGIPSITVLNRFVALEELIIHGLCFQEMISNEISVADVKLPNLKMVQAHIGTVKGAQALNFLGFLLRNGPLSVTRIFLQEDCPEIMHEKLLDLQKEFSKSRLSTAPREWSTERGQGCRFCDEYHEY